jgi:hypothetical protein
MAEEFLKFELTTEPEMKVLAFRVNGLITGISDLRPLFLGFGALFRGAMQKQFATGGAASGGWAKLSPAYSKWKADRFPGRPIGVLHGDLMRGMTGGAGYGEEIHKDWASFGLYTGPAEEHAGYFDAGTDKMPARPVIRFEPGESAKWRRLTEDWALETTAKSGWGKS